jgi:hypothetical protein
VRSIECLDGQREEGETGGRTGSAAAPPCRERKGEEEERKETRWLTGGTHLSAPLKKKKRRGEGKWAGWAVWAEKVRREVLFFFLFFFKPYFQNQIQFKSFSNFSKLFSNIL